MIWEIWWAWVAAGLVLAILELFAPGFIFVGFAVGAVAVGLLVAFGVVLPLGAWLEFIKVPAALLIGLWAAMQLAFTWVGPSFGTVAWWAHLAGFAAGVLFALLLRPSLRRRGR